MNFARKQLEKYGWSEGKGLGTKEDGITDAVKPKLKFDSTGIGYDASKQFTNHWWERVFNDAAKNVDIKDDENGCKFNLKSNESVEITTKDYSVRDFKKNNGLEYGSFLKTSKLIGSTDAEHYKVTAPTAFKDFATLTDEELFLACGGRTAHKGARHGLKLSGKLARIEKQEKMLLKKMRNVSLDDKTNIEKKMKKIKKYKDDSITNNNNNNQEIETNPGTTKKKNKKKLKNVSFSEETFVTYYTPDLDDSHESTQNTNNSQMNDTNLSNCDEGIEQDFDDDHCSKQISDNNDSFEEPQKRINDLSKAERKKLKKKRKHDKSKNTATNRFINDVLNDNKKRKLISEDVEMEDENVQQQCTYSKKKKCTPEKCKKKRDKIINTIVQSMDDSCRISDID